MSNRYKGGIISATPPTTTGGESGTASGAWTVEQQMQLTAAGLWPIQPLPKYIEDVFSTYLYTGNGSTQTITNGIDLSTYGGLTWLKRRSGVAQNHYLWDTARGAGNWLATNDTGIGTYDSTALTSFNSNGFSLGSSTRGNTNAETYASWTFRKQPKFFDVVTYTGNGSTQTINHNLGSTPGCIIYKSTSFGNNWIVYHRSLGEDFYTQLNTTSAKIYSTTVFDITAPTSTTFTVGSLGSGANVNGETYVAYLFAHNAGGFGLTGSDNVISCGSVSYSGATSVNLGYEPQWILWRKASGTDDWWMFDTMRGLVVDNGSGTGDKALYADLSNAETGTYGIDPTSTGFNLSAGWSNGDYIYIAIRRGPMKVPTSGTSVFSPVTYTGNGSSQSLTAGFPIDLSLFKYRGGATNSFEWFDRLRGTSPELRSAYTYAELATTTEVTSFASNTQVTVGASSDTGGTNVNGQTYVLEAFRRAPSFFDEVCYTGTGSATTFSHNLGVAPELMIVKNRSSAGYGWLTYSATLGATKYLQVNSTAAEGTVSTYWNNTSPTSSVFSVGTAGATNASGDTYVAYLFATCAGVSKVGSYTGTGTTKQVDCGFTGGARFVLIKRTDSTGDWYVWDSARGIVAGNDPYLLLNSSAAEVTSTDYIDTYSAGFEISSTAPAAINANGGTFIFLAIA